MVFHVDELTSVAIENVPEPRAKTSLHDSTELWGGQSPLPITPTLLLPHGLRELEIGILIHMF